MANLPYWKDSMIRMCQAHMILEVMGGRRWVQDGFAAIHLAAAHGYPDMVSLLAVLGASLDTGTRVMHPLL